MDASHPGIHFSSGGENQNSPQQGVNKPCLALLDLPCEIIQHIANFLPTSSAACLALCSRSLSQILGTQYWDTLYGRHQREREIFLSTLAQNLPAYFFCHECSLLCLNDAPGPLKPQYSSRKRRSCCEVQRGISHWTDCHHILRFPHVQLVMKRHYRGPDHGIPLDKLSFTEVSEEEGYSRQLSVEARIAADELLMRAQQWVLISADKGNNFPKACFANICPHLTTYNSRNELSRLFRCRLSHLHDQNTCPTCSGTFHCRYCPMEFQMETKQFKDQGTAVAITKWLNLGAGLTPLDPKWRNHVWIGRTVSNIFYDEPFAFPPGSIRASFEQQKGPSLDFVTAENTMKLLAKRDRQRHSWNHNGFHWESITGWEWSVVPIENIVPPEDNVPAKNTILIEFNPETRKAATVGQIFGWIFSLSCFLTVVYWLDIPRPIDCRRCR